MATRLLLNLHGQIHLPSHSWYPTTSAASNSFFVPRSSVSAAVFTRGQSRSVVEEMELKYVGDVEGEDSDDKSVGAIRYSRQFAPVEVFVSETRVVHHEGPMSPRRSVHVTLA